MILLAQILLVAAIAIVAMLFFPRREEAYPSFQVFIPSREEKREDFLRVIKKNNRWSILRIISLFNRPLMPLRMRERLNADLAIAKIGLVAEEFLLIQEVIVVLLLFIMLPLAEKRFLPAALASCVGIGYFFPRLWLSAKTVKIKREITRLLPDIIDLLTLCVNAGLDFMLALKWVVEKSKPTILNEELRNLMQEISIGKSRRAALLSLSQKYRLPEFSSFTRTLIQADRMGTSVAQALEIISEDMRRMRFNRGEQQALKAPLKLLIPLLLFIFPVVVIIIAGPILLQFMQTKTMFGG